MQKVQAVSTRAPDAPIKIESESKQAILFG